MKIIIRDDVVVREQREFEGKKFEVVSQNAFLETEDGQRRKFVIKLGRGVSAYRAGSYSLGGDSFTVGKYGDLTLGRVVLESVVAGAKP